MFGKTNRKQEIRDREQELEECRSSLGQAEQVIGKMSLMWIEAGQKISELERSQRELERQMKQVSSAAGNVSDQSKRQSEEGRKLLAQAGEIAERQEELRAQQKQIRKESKEAESQRPIALAKIIAPITTELSNGMEEMRNMLDDVVDIGRQMEVLSLNAAVEARRMGENGGKFVEAAEEIRSMSEKYRHATSSLAQQMQIVGMRWQKSRSEIEEVEERLKQQYGKLEEAKNACESMGEEMLSLPIAELRGGMEEVLEDKAVEEACEEFSRKIGKTEEDLEKQQEAWGGLRQTVSEAKAMIKEIQEE